MTLALTLQVCLLLACPSKGGIVSAAVPFASALEQEPSSPPQESQPAPAQTAPLADTPPKTDSETSKPSADDTKPPAKRTSSKKRRRKTSAATASGQANPDKAAVKNGDAPDADNPSKVVVKNGGTTDPPIKIVPELTQQQASSQQQSARRLLEGTDVNLKTIAARQLSPTQQAMVDQIQQYLAQAKTAREAGDLEREHTLALKAHLLSEDLVKH